MADLNRIRSLVSGVTWPGMPGDAGAMLLALQYQFEQTQWWPFRQLLDHQLRQFSLLFRHAIATVPFYRERFAGFDPEMAMTPERYRELPILTRRQIQNAGERMISAAVPGEHHPLYRTESSGSTAEPIVTTGTRVTQLMWQACLLREHLWHRRDFSGKLAAIRSKAADVAYPDWGPPVDWIYPSGPSVILDLSADLDRQVEWLKEQEPDYVMSFASNIRLLARRSRELGVRLPRLRQARTYGEALQPDVRPAVREAWGVEVVDCYSSEELGYIALQCPGNPHYHVQSESLMLEILRPDGTPCEPGETGQIVVSTLHNFAMPFIRYASGDYAEAGGPCTCGRGLPVISRVLGRQRNLLTLPDGRQRWPSFPSEQWGHVAPIRQLQLVQRARDRIEIRIVAQRPLSAEEKSRLAAVLQDCLGYPFAMEITEVAEIPRSAGLKFEDFVSELPN